MSEDNPETLPDTSPTTKPAAAVPAVQIVATEALPPVPKGDWRKERADFANKLLALVDAYVDAATFNAIQVSRNSSGRKEVNQSRLRLYQLVVGEGVEADDLYAPVQN